MRWLSLVDNYLQFEFLKCVYRSYEGKLSVGQLCINCMIYDNNGIEPLFRVCELTSPCIARPVGTESFVILAPVLA